jgi:hypothetical protein
MDAFISQVVVIFVAKGDASMGCCKWFLILLLILALLAAVVFLVATFGAVALWTIFGLLLPAAILLAMMGKG